MLNEISEVIGKPDYRRQIANIYKKYGYSDSYIDSGQIKNTKAWNDLMDIYLPDEQLAIHHKELLNAVKIGHYVFPASESDEEIKETIESYGLPCLKIKKNLQWKRAYYSIPNTDAKRHALDMAYKLKKKYGDLTITHKFSELTDEELEGEIAGIISEAIELTAGKEKKGSK